jgi:hypothetical protein
MAGFNPVPSSIQISRMLRRAPSVGGIAFKSGVTQRPFALKKALGGGIAESAIPDHPFKPVIGAINTDTPGRTDDHPTHVPPGSYVMPADIVSSLGQGNTGAGQQILARIFLPLQAQSGEQTEMMAQAAPYGATGAPFGAQVPHLPSKAKGPPRIALRPQTPGQPQTMIQARGGVVPGEPGSQFLDRVSGRVKPGTPINISGGEFVVPPEEVERRGRGDIDRGHEILDAWVNHLRAEHIKTLKKLPGPAK